MDLSPLRPDPLILLAALALDGLLGDPVYRLHPIRLLGSTLMRIENALRYMRLDGYIGGSLLFAVLALLCVGEISGAVLYMEQVYSGLSWVFHLYMLYSLIALRDLLKHGLAIDRAANADDLEGARTAAAMLVGRDTSRMDLAACRRAGMESLAALLLRTPRPARHYAFQSHQHHGFDARQQEPALYPLWLVWRALGRPL
jgi:adenosylcobinamide-phosphate synthase